MPIAFITGVTGQDGSWLAECLLGKGYAVHGLVRRTSSPSSRIAHLLEHERFTLHHGDLTDVASLEHALESAQPDEVYNLAAQSHVGLSWQQPAYTADVTGLGALRVFEAVRTRVPTARIYQASSCEIFGDATAPQDEQSARRPLNPYATAKAFAWRSAENLRNAYGMFICNGILFNHESERRGETFVTRKITRAVGRIAAGTQKTLALGDLTPRRDWGHAEDYVDAMWRMLQQDAPGDFVIGTGVSHSVQDFVEAAFDHAGLDWEQHVVSDPSFVRPLEVPELRADPRHAQRVLGWEPSHDFSALVQRMVDHDLQLARREAS